MHFKIHRGTKEIGGSCVEVWTETTRIVLDFGMPLVNIDGTPFHAKNYKVVDPEKVKSSAAGSAERQLLPDIPQLFSKPSGASLIISHAHQDHYGLVNYVASDCPVYLGRATLKLIELTNTFTNREWKIKKPCHFNSGESFSIGDIEVTPYLMDHSAFDAYAFMVKAGGKSLFYSGDFRIHGRKRKAFYWFSYNAEKDVDYLLMEGTTIGREDQRFPTEDEIEENLVQTFQETKGINLVYTSGQNIDRLVSIYRACKKTGKLFVIDFYIANVLTDLVSLGHTLPHPCPAYPEIKVRFPHLQTKLVINRGQKDLAFRFYKFKITTPEIVKQYKSIVTTVRPSMLADIRHFKNLNEGTLVFSMWSGYKTESETKKFLDDLTALGMTVKDIHTSGHADLAGLKLMVKALKPKNIVPIHTLQAAQYKSLFNGVNVLEVDDGEEVNIR